MSPASGVLHYKAALASGYISSTTSRPAEWSGALGPLRVTGGNPRSEHFASGVPQKAAVLLWCRSRRQRATSGREQVQQHRTLSLCFRQRLRDFASVLDKKPRYRAERAVLQSNDRDRLLVR